MRRARRRTATAMKGRTYDAVALLGFGGPSSVDDVRPFLDRVLAGKQIPNERYERVVSHYALIGGASPYNALTQRQADALALALRQRNVDLDVCVAFRNAPPYPDDVVRDLVKRGARDVFCVVMAPHQSSVSWLNYVAAFESARTHALPAVLNVDYSAAYFDHPLFVRAYAERIEDAVRLLRRDTLDDVELLFTAHSIPLAVDGADLYAAQFRRSAELIASAVAAPRWSVAYQSRSGSPRDPWLEPSVRDALTSLPARGVTETVVAPIGFLCDHVELLYDLDIEAQAIAGAAGVRMVRANALNDHPLFISMLADLTMNAVYARAGGIGGYE